MSELEIDIGEIELGEELGHGQFGCVCKAKWKGQVRAPDPLGAAAAHARLTRVLP